MTEDDIKKLCDTADALDSAAYAAIPHELDADAFVAELKRIIEANKERAVMLWRQWGWQ